MSIKDQLRNCYETGDNIEICLSDIPNLTLDDIFTIIYLVSIERCKFHCECDFDYFICVSIGNYDEICILREFSHPINLAILYLINDNCETLNVTRVSDGDCELIDFHIRDEFIRIATESDMMDYPIVRSIMRAFGIGPKLKTENASMYIGNYLSLLVNTKSARSNV